MICNRKEKMNLFSAAFVAVLVLFFAACSDEESVGPVEREDPSVHDLDVFTQAKSAKEYMNPSLKYGEMTDPRDGQVYKTIKIGNLVWMAENLNFSDSVLLPNIAGNNLCYDGKKSYCNVGGRLYSWSAAMNVSPEYLTTNTYSSYSARERELHKIKRGICPEGWSIPTSEEFWSLRAEYPTEDAVANVLKSVEGWRGNGAGWNTSGFTALPVGICAKSGCINAGFEAYFWTASESSSYDAEAMKISYEAADVEFFLQDKRRALSVRCVLDTAYVKTAEYDSIERVEALEKVKNLYDPAKVVKGSFVDKRDKREYSTVKIGDQNWMAENLDYKASDSVSACYAHEDSLCTIYGRLYTYTYARDSACPAGWHLPTWAEYNALIERIGEDDPYDVAGLVLKSEDYWVPYQSGDYYNHDASGVDLLGFRALPGGLGELGSKVDSFFNLGSKANFWVYEGDSAFSAVFKLEDKAMSAGFSWEGSSALASVRCLQGELANFFYCPEDESEYKKPTFIGVDSTQIQDGYMKDLRDGKYYKIVTIGKQTWMAENLNGDYGNYYIHEGCYLEAENTCDSLGVFYTWSEAMDVDGRYTPAEDYYCRHNEVRRGACPLGWHVPSEADWLELIETVGDPLSASVMLKSKRGWTNENGLDSYGFNVYASGLTPGDKFATHKGEQAFFWARDDKSKGTGRAIVFSGDDYAVVEVIDAEKSARMPVRCIKDSPLLSEAVEIQEPPVSLLTGCKSAKSDKCVYGTLTDERDGQSYKTVQVGTQTWMAENLKVDYEGSPKAGFYTWEMAIDSAEVFSDGAESCRSYFNCNLVEPVLGICPEGWHLPSIREWRKLVAVVGGQSKAWEALKSSEGWKNNGGVDAYGWNATPAGYWDVKDSSVHDEGESANFWSWQDDGWKKYVSMGFYADSSQGLEINEMNKNDAVSVRCVKD